ncbi:uncharacterized protein RCC_01509 [Ramularia collo-cygni]|uniref:Uncharacterized protein n=1 Tax=Ramularia collo-cygni TaxID=112498 RepID=A0A2D3UQR8_9PEZI|nr:uncharacterized protein RCC_01509 [Ramularia collo-cygni]CZT15675.1 uncharacterized protein RCC_01509 [Ramularia collo-cygni]
MESLMWRPTAAELAAATAMARRPQNRPSQHLHVAKQRHADAMKAIVLGSPDLPRGLTFSQQREVALRDFIRRNQDLAATADTISPANLEAVVSQMSEVSPRTKPARLRRTYPPPRPAPSIGWTPDLMPTINRAASRADDGLRFVFDGSMYAGASAQRPLVIDDHDDHDAVPRSNVPQAHVAHWNMPQMNIPQIITPQSNMPQSNMPQSNILQSNIPHSNGMPFAQQRYPLRSKGAVQTQSLAFPEPAPIEASALFTPTQTVTAQIETHGLEPVSDFGRIEAPALSTTVHTVTVQEPDLQLKPTTRSGTCVEQAIDLDAEGVDHPQLNQTMHYSGSAAPLQNSMLAAAAPTNMSVNAPWKYPRLHFPCATMPARSAIAPAAPTKPLTKKEKRAAKAAANTSEKQRVQKAKQQAKQKQMELPSRSASTRKDRIDTQVSQVRQRFFARAKNEMHQGSRSYPVVIEALQGAITDLQMEELLYQTAQRAPQASPAPPTVAVPAFAEASASRRFWGMPVGFVAKGMAALRQHLDHADAANAAAPESNAGRPGGGGGMH